MRSWQGAAVQFIQKAGFLFSIVSSVWRTLDKSRCVCWDIYNVSEHTHTHKNILLLCVLYFSMKTLFTTVYCTYRMLCNTENEKDYWQEYHISAYCARQTKLIHHAHQSQLVLRKVFSFDAACVCFCVERDIFIFHFRGSRFECGLLYLRFDSRKWAMLEKIKQQLRKIVKRIFKHFY